MPNRMREVHCAANRLLAKPLHWYLAACSPLLWLSLTCLTACSTPSPCREWADILHVL